MEGIQRRLSSDQAKEAFDELMDIARSFTMAGGAACNSVVFEPMVVSVVLGQHKRLQEAEAKLHRIGDQLQATELRVYERIWQNIKEKR